MGVLAILNEGEGDGAWDAACLGVQKRVLGRVFRLVLACEGGWESSWEKARVDTY